MTEVPYRPLPVDQDGVVYAYGPDSFRRSEVPSGATTEFRIDDSAAYPGTTRRVWLHVPAGVDPRTPAPVVVFNDGWWYLDPEGDVRGGIVLDNLVHDGAMPPVVGVFVEPGVFVGAEHPTNRNAEYDAFGARYSGFLADEVLPRVRERWNVSRDPRDVAICGGSSGGNAAFTAAWLRPDAITRVIAFNSSFAQMPGGDPYPRLVAREARKPLRVMLDAAHRDLNWNQPEDNWFAETLKVATAFAEAGYDIRLVVGDGGHSLNHAGVLLPDALRWIWREAPLAPGAGRA